MKRRFGPFVESRIGTMRRKNAWIRSLILNMLLVANEEVEKELEMAG
jgi:hypothetical protein